MAAATTWRGDIHSLCSSVLKVFERVNTNMDGLLYKRTFTKDTSQETKHTTQVVDVHLKKTEKDLEVRSLVAWTGTGKRPKHANEMYWGIRTERQDLLLAEIVLKIFARLGEMGFAQVECSINDKTYVIPISSFKQQSYNIIPLSAIHSTTDLTGGFEIPGANGVMHHIVVGTSTGGVNIAVDLGYAQYHAFAKKDPETNTAIFAISEEKELLGRIAATFKQVRSKMDTEGPKKSPLFKHKLSSFFTVFSVDPLKLKELGNADFENKKYEDALQWYSHGISVEAKDKKNDLLHILYSNRSTAYYQMKQYQLALDDANQAIAIAPKWPKGYLRKSAALEGLELYDDADEASNTMRTLEEEAQKLKEEEENTPKNKKRKI